MVGGRHCGGFTPIARRHRQNPTKNPRRKQRSHIPLRKQRSPDERPGGGPARAAAVRWPSEGRPGRPLLRDTCRKQAPPPTHPADLHPPRRFWRSARIRESCTREAIPPSNCFTAASQKAEIKTPLNKPGGELSVLKRTSHTPRIMRARSRRNTARSSPPDRARTRWSSLARIPESCPVGSRGPNRASCSNCAQRATWFPSTSPTQAAVRWPRSSTRYYGSAYPTSSCAVTRTAER